jgi:prepilin signal peptidase PulO-like enzyme (type II secretory pathway)
MKARRALSVWLPFVAASTLTLLVYLTLWPMKWYWVVLSALAFLCVFLAATILVRKGVTRASVLGIVIGLLIGQWWLVEYLVSQLLWRFRGFAP